MRSSLFYLFLQLPFKLKTRNPHSHHSCKSQKALLSVEMTITEKRKPSKDFERDSDMIRFVLGGMQRTGETDRSLCLVYSFHHSLLYATVFIQHL